MHGENKGPSAPQDSNEVDNGKTVGTIKRFQHDVMSLLKYQPTIQSIVIQIPEISKWTKLIAMHILNWYNVAFSINFVKNWFK